MIVSVETLKGMTAFADVDESVLQMNMDAIEDLIRAYTNNNFQNRIIRFSASSDGNVLLGGSPYLKKGDTIQISNSINNGLYVIIESDGDTVTVDKELFIAEKNLVTKVEYPATVVQGAINLLKWELSGREKVGIQSESISRHSVTYFSQDANNQVMGYPVSLLGFLAPYKKARF